jgi:hypothetical protein
MVGPFPLQQRTATQKQKDKKMPKAKKALKLRDQKPAKDPKGGGHKHGVPTKHLNAVDTSGSKDQRHGHRQHNLN